MSKTKTADEASKMYKGTIVQRGEKWYWRHRLPNGRITQTALSCAYSKESAIRQIMYLEFHQTYPTIAIKTNQEQYYVPPMNPLYAAHAEQKAQTLSVAPEIQLPLSELFDAFISSPRRNAISKGVEANYECTVRKFVEYFARKKYKTANKITVVEAEEYMAYRWNDGISGATYNDILNRLRIVFSLAVPEQENPFSKIKPKPKHTEERQAFTEKQLQLIWKTLASPAFHIMHKEEVEILLTLALNTGLRLGDLCNLQWKSIDFNKRMIKVTPSKTKSSSGKKVLLPMNDQVYDILKKQNALTTENNYVLPQLANRYAYNKDGISHDIIRLLEVSGIQTKEDADTAHRKERISRYSFHSFRHTFASMLIAQGVTPITVSKLLGHTTLNMTNRYVHLAEESARSAVSKLTHVLDN